MPCRKANSISFSVLDLRNETIACVSFLEKNFGSKLDSFTQDPVNVTGEQIDK
jgi:hypothetical protein